MTIQLTSEKVQETVSSFMLSAPRVLMSMSWFILDPKKSFTRAKARLWPIGYLKLLVIFHKRANNYRALLQKMNYKDKKLWLTYAWSKKKCHQSKGTTVASRNLRVSQVYIMHRTFSYPAHMSHHRAMNMLQITLKCPAHTTHNLDIYKINRTF